MTVVGPRARVARLARPDIRLRLTLPLVLLAMVLFAMVMPWNPAQAQDMWLDYPPTSWNDTPEAAELPDPVAGDGTPIDERCLGTLREPEGEVETALVAKGWMLYGPMTTAGTTTIVTALSAFDGMCRPLGFQAFVTSDGGYAGTLSPVRMDSRTDGSLQMINLDDPARFSADFSRYTPDDALCCPSRVDRVTYELAIGEMPSVKPVEIAQGVSPQATDQPSVEPVPAESDDLYGRIWRLTAMGERTFDAEVPNIEFDGTEMFAAGSTGCNQFGGGFTTEGDTLTFGTIVTTRRACLPAELNALEAGFLQALQATSHYELTDNALTLLANGAPTMTFSAD